MKYLREDNNGFVNFPLMDNNFDHSHGKTLVYIVAFDIDSNYILSNTTLGISGEYLTDDISGRSVNLYTSEEVDNGYFRKITRIDGVDKMVSIPLISSLCIGWHENSFVYKGDASLWFATFRELSNEGRKLYYSMKKLHNNKEVRILTFNFVK